MEEIFISFVVPVYNVEKYLKRCVDSILSQKCGSMEVILVDDGAKDNSGAICDEYAKKDNRVSVVHKKNGGLSDARNVGIECAKGRFICFIDSDDWIEKNMLSDMMSISEFDDCDVIVYGYKMKSEYIDIADTSNVTYRCYSGEQALDLFVKNKINGHAWNKIVRRTLFDNPSIRFPVGRNYEDIPTTYKYFIDAEKVMVIDKKYYNYFVANNTSITSNDTYLNLKDFFLSEEEMYHGVKNYYNKNSIDNKWLKCFRAHLLVHLYIKSFYKKTLSDNENEKNNVAALNEKVEKILRHQMISLGNMKNYSNYKKYLLFRFKLLKPIISIKCLGRK